MNKRVFALTLLFAVVLPLFAGCGSTGTSFVPSTDLPTEQSEISGEMSESVLTKEPSSIDQPSEPSKETPTTDETLPTEITDVTKPTEPTEPTEPIEPSSEEPTETPTEPSKGKRVSFIAAGDNIIHEAVYTDAMTLASAEAATSGYKEKYYFDSMYNGVSSIIRGADLAFVNMECPVAGEEYGIAGYPYFNAPYEAAQALARIGFDIVNAANNHMLDMDHTCTGLKNTVANLSKTGMTVIGGYTKSDYDNIRVVEKNGIKIAFLSYTTCSNMETINPSSPEMIVPWAAEGDIRRQTALARKAADFTVVSMHWGIENSETVSEEQRRLANLLNECGVDVILGHHSHTVLPVEWVGSGSKKTLCYYSLGNFLSTQHPIKNLTGLFASFELYIDENGNKSVENAAAIPHMTWYSTSRDSLQIYLLKDVTSDLISSHGSQLRTAENGGTFTLADVKRYVEKQVASEFLR